MYSISKDKLPELFALISKSQKLYIPTDRNGISQFAPYENGMKLSERLNTNRSAKDFFFPQTENLYEVKMQGKKIEVKDTRSECENFVIFGVRACDVRSFSILDKVYLVDPVDSYYKNRREHATIVSLACNRPEETCFCSSFGIDASQPEGDVTAWEAGDELYLESVTPKGEALVESIKQLLNQTSSKTVDAVKNAIKTVMSKLPLANLSFDKLKDEELISIFNSDKWDSLSQSCLGCGSCTFVCPTCQCYDIREFDTGNGIKKFRCWDSCMYSDFTKMAHGNPRTTQLQRFRQRFMHKLVYFPDNNDGEFGCVGCGRCISKCPISMNIVKVAKALEVNADE